MPLLVLLLGKMYLCSSSWVLKMSMDRSSADSLGILIQCLIALAVEKDLIVCQHLSAISLARTLSSLPSSCHLVFLLLSSCSNSFFSVWKDLLDSKSQDSNHTGLAKLLGKSNRSPSRWLNKGSSSHSLERRIVSNLDNIEIIYFISLFSNPGVFSSVFSGNVCGGVKYIS